MSEHESDYPELDMSSYLITGANKGIGLELVKQLSALPASQVSTVFAAIRSDVPQQLQDLINGSNDRVVVVKVQVTDRASIDQAAKVVADKLDGEGLDCLINNAGTQTFALNGIENMDDSDLHDCFAINVVAVHKMVSAFLPLLKKGQGKKIVTMCVRTFHHQLTDRETEQYPL
jgi:NAD(P)-dependent dehydrogenase (short-subunit alcohol dehydrogenase family)